MGTGKGRFMVKVVGGGLLAGALATGLLMGQDRPHVGYIFPPGAAQGETFTMLVGGQNLEGVTNIRFAGGQVKGRILSFNREIDRQVIRNMENQKIYLEEKLKKATDSERGPLEKQLERIMKNLAYQEPEPTDPVMAKYMAGMMKKKQINAQLTDRVRLEITVDPKCPPGPLEVRLYTPKGYSDPMTFHVGSFPTAREKEPNDERPQATDVGFVPGVWCGQVMPGESDMFKFSARRGQNLVFKVQARDLVPYLADAVPGWFQPVVAIYDDKGLELAYADDTLGQPDPVVTFTAPSDGDYYFEIHDSIWRGREDFVYRITAGEVPHVWGVFPLGGKRGSSISVTARGLNLPETQFNLNPLSREDGVVTVDRLGDVAVNPFRFQLDEGLDELMEPESGASGPTPVALSLNSVMNGHIAKNGEKDRFVFEGRVGQKVVAEIFARRLGSPLDSSLKLLDANGKSLTNNDDYPDPSFGLVAHQADSRVEYTLPSDGPYTLELRDTQGKGGDLYAYRLRLSPLRPDFRVRLTPSSAGIGRGGAEPFQLHILRRDGFTNEIRIALTNAPDGFKISPDRVKPAMSPVKITLTAPRDFLGETNLSLYATATIDGRPVRRRVEPAEDMMQAFFYRHLVPAQEWLLAWAPKEKGGAQALPPWVVQLKPASVLVAKHLCQALSLEPEKAEALSKVYVAEREAGWQRMGAANGDDGGGERLRKVIGDNVKMMQGVLAKQLDEAQMAKVPKIIGPLFGELEREVAYLLDIGVGKDKVEEAMVVLAAYTWSVQEEVYAKLLDKKMTREEASEHIKKLRALTVGELSPILGDDLAQRWANQPVALGSKRA